MYTIALTQNEFEDFRDVQIRPRADWPATFSCNVWREVWPFNSYGYTRERIYLEGQIPRLDEIVRIVLNVRPEEGQFFISDDGIYKTRGSRYTHC